MLPARFPARNDRREEDSGREERRRRTSLDGAATTAALERALCDILLDLQVT